MQYAKSNDMPLYAVLYAVTLHARKHFEAYLITGNIKHFPTEPFVVTPHHVLDILAQSTTPTQASGYVVLIRWLQSALIPFVTTQASGY